MPNSLWSHGLWPTRLLHPWDFPGERLEWGAIAFSRGSSRPRDQTRVSCIAGRRFNPLSHQGSLSIPFYIFCTYFFHGAYGETKWAKWAMLGSQESLTCQENHTFSLWNEREPQSGFSGGLPRTPGGCELDREPQSCSRCLTEEKWYLGGFSSGWSGANKDQTLASSIFLPGTGHGCVNSRSLPVSVLQNNS